MKASFTPSGALERKVASAVLLSLAIWIYPEVSQASGPQLLGQNQALVFEIKQNQTTTSADETTPTVIALKKLLTKYNSPLADDKYVYQLANSSEVDRIVGITFVESGFVHNYRNNFSGIMTSRGLKTYADKADWITDMNQLLATRYADKDFAQMNCVYVQPCSTNWEHGAKKVVAEFNTLKVEAATNNATIVVAGQTPTPELAIK